MEKTKGQLFVVAAPSGGGKTSLIKAVLNTLDAVVVSISHTTRPMRPGEEEGVDYFFVDEDAFVRMIDAHAFLEYAKVFNYYYGTSVEQINRNLSAGIDVILDIDWQGARQIRRLFKDAVTVFVIPPALKVLEERLRQRKRDEPEIIRGRMARARDEMRHYAEFDYLIVNDKFEQAAHELSAIIVSNRLKMEQQVLRQKKLLSFLLTDE